MLPPPVLPPPVSPGSGVQQPGRRDNPRGPNGSGPAGNGHSGGHGGGAGLVVRPFAGPGVPAEFDPETGALRAGHGLGGYRSGVYGDLGGVSVVFYRGHDGRLRLWVGDRSVLLDGPVAVDWSQVAWRTIRFAVTVGGETLTELTYRALPAEMDLGAYIRDVLTDSSRRESVFT